MSMVDLSNQLAANSGPFNPPVGSRLLAFGSRTTVTATNTNLPAKSFAPPEAALSLGNPLTPNIPGSHNQRFGGMTPPPPGVGMNMGLQSPDVDSQFGSNARATPSERSIRSFSPFAQPQAQTSYTNEDIQEAMRLAQANEAFRRQLAMSPPDRAGLGMGSDNGSPYIDLGRSSPQFAGNAGGYEMGATGAAAKGSRFAKFFDAKHRDMQPGPAMRKGPMGPGLVSTSPHPGQRSDGMPLAGMGGNMGDGRAMEELFAMLQNSAQVRKQFPFVTYHSLSTFRPTVFPLRSRKVAVYQRVDLMYRTLRRFRRFSNKRSNNNSFKTRDTTHCTRVGWMTGTSSQMGWSQV